MLVFIRKSPKYSAWLTVLSFLFFVTLNLTAATLNLEQQIASNSDKR